MKKQKSEQKIYGVHACLAVFKNRPQDIIKIILTKERAPLFSEVMQYMAKQKKAYHLETSEEISKFAKSVHHEGVCLLAKSKLDPTLSHWMSIQVNKKQLLLMGLDTIDNPHNLGAIIRSAAHFSVDAIIYSSKNTHHTDPAVARVAQGGLEYVPIFRVESWDEFINFCHKKNIALYTTSDKAKNSVSTESFKEHSLIIMGNEGTGLSQSWQKITNTHIKINGTNLVESLNISVASGILMALYRQKHHLIKK